MATLSQWVEGARPRTLPAAFAPVIAGTAVAAWEERIVWLPALLCLVVSLALQIGVNYANDYSDGIRGTDDERVGPVRLVGQKLASPQAVKAAALGSLVLAAIAGLALTAITGHWWLLAVGAAAMAAAWLYTGGPRPYGYAGLGEVFVFVFFGLVAVGGTAYVQTGGISALAVAMGVSQGAICCAILVANNLRDIPGDSVVGKRTLAVRLGDARTRVLYLALMLVGLLIPVAVTLGALLGLDWPMLALLGAGAAFPAAAGVRAVRAGALGRSLIPVLGSTGKAMLSSAVLFAAGVAISLA